MSGTWTLDHIIVTVDDLETASADFTALGFTVSYGGKHASGTTHNAIITLADGSYLELIARTNADTVDREVTDFSPFFKFGEGIAGYALYTDDLEAQVAAMRERGVPMQDIQPGQRARPDNEILRWKITTIEGTTFPLFIQDVTPRVMRVSYTPEHVAQQNGVIGVSSLMIIVPQLSEWVDKYKKILDMPPLTDHYAAHFMCGTAHLVISEPVDEDMREHLQKYRSRPYRLQLKTTHRDRFGELNLNLTHGARIDLVE